MRNWLVCAAVVCLVLPSAAVATVYDVASVAQLRSALAAVNAGDEIRIAYGVYQVTTAQDPKHWFTRTGSVASPIRIVGLAGPNGEKPVFDATGQAIERGIFYIWDYTSNYVIENLEIRNARGQDYYSNNAAAAYINGDNITFRNCYSHHNDNGWFATSSASNTLLEYCETAYNGKISGGDMTHNHYVQSDSLTVRGCYIHDSTEGQNFKSRCKSLRFEYNWVENAASYEWELASNNKGNTLMIGNVIIKNPNAGNSRILGLSDGTASDATSGTLTMINNTIVATTSNHRYFYSNAVASTNLVLYNNAFVGPSSAVFDSGYWLGSGSRSGSNNWFRTGATLPGGITGSLFGTDPGMVNLTGKDYHLLATSDLRNAGLANPQWLNWSGAWVGLVPDKEYLANAQTKVRLADTTLDIGAFEGPKWPGDIDNDGAVDVVDLITFAGSWGLSKGASGYDARCDLNGDNAVDVIDLLMLAEDWGQA